MPGRPLKTRGSLKAHSPHHPAEATCTCSNSGSRSVSRSRSADSANANASSETVEAVSPRQSVLGQMGRIHQGQRSHVFLYGHRRLSLDSDQVRLQEASSPECHAICAASHAVRGEIVGTHRQRRSSLGRTRSSAVRARRTLYSAEKTTVIHDQALRLGPHLVGFRRYVVGPRRD
jgi:hypothetical protein